MKKPLSTSRRQAGAIDLILICALLFLALVVLCGIRLAPIYIDHWAVKEALTAVINESGSEGVTSKKKILGSFRNRLMVNRIEFVEDDDIKIERSTSHLLAQLNYERRVPLMFNVDAVIKFPETKVEAPLAGPSR